MKNKAIVGYIFLMLITYQCYCQSMTQNEVVDLVEILNNKTVNNIQLTFTQNKAELNWYDIKTILHVRNKLDIPTTIDSTSIKKPVPQTGNRQTGPIYFKYNFKPTTSVETTFRANKYGKVFFTIKFNELDTININSRLNNFSCVHRTSDSSPHVVQWSGDTYLSLLLDPEKTANSIHFKVQGITISGKFEREDQQQINTQYSKNLREVLRQAFETFFNESTFENKNNGIVLLEHSK